MITTERNTLELYAVLLQRLFEAVSDLRPIPACMVGMAWQRWADRQGLWGTRRFADLAVRELYPVE
jgi:hypothetical protein